MGNLSSQHRLISALMCEPVDRTPVWLMRQAGRYLPEYRKLRSSFKDFVAFYKTPELACEATLQPLRRFPLLDACILFSDILVVPEAMGLDLKFYENQGPLIHDPVRDEAGAKRLTIPEDAKASFSYVKDAIALIKKEVAGKKPLIGFSGSPWTLAVYMIDGSSKNQFLQSRKMAWQNAALLTSILKKIATTVVDYLKMQAAAGVDALMIFDSWGGLLPFDLYQIFSLDWMKKIVTEIKTAYPKLPIILFTKGIHPAHLPSMTQAQAHAIGIDWTIDMAQARAMVGKNVCLQGNLDPAVMCTDKDTITRCALQILNAHQGHRGHVFNLGHGITPQANPDLVAHLTETVAAYSLA